MDCIYTVLSLEVATRSAEQYYLTFTHSCTHSHTDGGVNHAMQQPARREQLGLGVKHRVTLTLNQEEPGIELETFRSPASPLYLPGHTPPVTTHHHMWSVSFY